MHRHNRIDRLEIDRLEIDRLEREFLGFLDEFGFPQRLEVWFRRRLGAGSSERAEELAARVISDAWVICAGEPNTFFQYSPGQFATFVYRRAGWILSAHHKERNKLRQPEDCRRLASLPGDSVRFWDHVGAWLERLPPSDRRRRFVELALGGRSNVEIRRELFQQYRSETTQRKKTRQLRHDAFEYLLDCAAAESPGTYMRLADVYRDFLQRNE